MNSDKDGIALAPLSTEASAALLERVVVGGDLSKLSAQERMQYYAATCASVGLNPVTRLRLAHYTDIIVRMNGQDHRYEGDWIKSLQVTLLPPKGAGDE